MPRQKNVHFTRGHWLPKWPRLLWWWGKMNWVNRRHRLARHLRDEVKMQRCVVAVQPHPPIRWSIRPAHFGFQASVWMSLSYLKSLLGGPLKPFRALDELSWPPKGSFLWVCIVTLWGKCVVAPLSFPRFNWWVFWKLKQFLIDFCVAISVYISFVTMAAHFVFTLKCDNSVHTFTISFHLCIHFTFIIMHLSFHFRKRVYIDKYYSPFERKKMFLKNFNCVLNSD